VASNIYPALHPGVALRRVGIDAHVYERAIAFNPNAGRGQGLTLADSLTSQLNLSVFMGKGVRVGVV
jgi:hypothetical protein